MEISQNRTFIVSVLKFDQNWSGMLVSSLNFPSLWISMCMMSVSVKLLCIIPGCVVRRVAVLWFLAGMLIQ